MVDRTTDVPTLKGFGADTTANKGEWSEIYVMLRLLGDGRLYAADEHLQRNPNSYVEVLEVLREEIVKEVMRYVVDPERSVISVVVDGITLASVPASEFVRQADEFYSYLRAANPVKLPGSNKREVYATPELVEFSKRIGVGKIEAPSMSSGDFGKKVDIVLKMRDSRTCNVSVMGFSIKSHVASPPTLYNVTKTSGFLYEVDGMDDKGMETWNAIKDHAPRGENKWTYACRYFREQGWTAHFLRTNNPQTSKNLFYVRESMTDLLAWIYKRALLEDYPNSSDFITLSRELAEENPLNYPNPDLYEKVIKDWLFAGFSGLTSVAPWDGREQVNGGYIVVKQDGEVLCYHSSDREAFREYLFCQSHIEYVSQSPDKYNWGRVEKDEQGRYLLRLNGSARFYSTFKEVDR